MLQKNSSGLNCLGVSDPETHHQRMYDMARTGASCERNGPHGEGKGQLRAANNLFIHHGNPLLSLGNILEYRGLLIQGCQLQIHTTPDDQCNGLQLCSPGQLLSYNVPLVISVHVPNQHP